MSLIDDYQQQINENPQTPFWIYNKLGEAYVEEDKLEKAVAIYQQALEVYPEEPSIYRFLGMALEKAGDIEGEIVNYQKAIALNPQQPYWVYTTLAQLLSDREKYYDAIVIYQQVIQIYPDKPELYRFLGVLQEKIGDFQGEIKSYQQAIELQAQQPHWLYATLGKLLINQEKYDEAIEVYQQGIWIHPQKTEWTYDNLENLLEKTNTFKNHLNFYQKLTEKYSDIAEVHYRLGQALTSVQQWEKAIDAYEKAIELNENNWEFYQGLGDALTQINKKNEAQLAYQSAEEKFYQAHDFSKSDLPTDFEWDYYLIFNSFLGLRTKWQAIKHFLLYGHKQNRLYCLKHFYDPEKRPSIIAKSQIKNIQHCFNKKKQKLCVLVHVYYFDLWSELKKYIDNLTVEYDIYINIVSSIWTPEIHNQIRLDIPESRIFISANQGKDIGGYLSLMANINFSKYDIFCLLHTKKSPYKHHKIVEIWRQDLLNAILKTPTKAKDNLKIMRQDSQIGALGSRYWHSTAIENNEKHYYRLLDEFNIKPEARGCEYISGTMMLVRSKIMKTIYDKMADVELEDGDNLDLKSQTDGQIAHALERIIGNVIKNYDMYFFWQD